MYALPVWPKPSTLYFLTALCASLRKEICLGCLDQLCYRQPIMAFKCMPGQAPRYLTSQFIIREQVSKRTTRSS